MKYFLCVVVSTFAYSIPLLSQVIANDNATGPVGPVVIPVQNECEACVEPRVVFTFPPASPITVYSTNILFFKQDIKISATPLKLVRKIRAELSYFEYVPQSADCFTCNRNSASMGNLQNSTVSGQGGSGGGSHAMEWIFLPPKAPGTFPGEFNIALPPIVNCCTGTIRWCVRYVVEFDDCTVCSKTVCYEKIKNSTVTPPDLKGN